MQKGHNVRMGTESAVKLGLVVSNEVSYNTPRFTDLGIGVLFAIFKKHQFKQEYYDHWVYINEYMRYDTPEIRKIAQVFINKSSLLKYA